MRYICLVILFGQLMLMAQSQPLYDSVENKIQNIHQNESWILFARKMLSVSASSLNQVSIVHLGDSHIQGGYFTNIMRTLCSQQFGTSSRGWVFPYDLAHSNGPEDITFRSNGHWMGIKYNHNLPSEHTCISGYALNNTDSIINFSITLKNESRIQFPFTTIAIYHNDSLLSLTCENNPQITTRKIETALFITTIKYNELHDSMQLKFQTHIRVPQSFRLTGINLQNDHAALTYHAIGINGMAYSMYDKYIEYLPVLGTLHPDCVIFSLGTNDAYMQLHDTILFKRQLRSLVDNIRKINPSCCIILTTAGDHLRNKTLTNPSLLKVNAAIIATANEKNCAYWDFFKVMGGLGSTKNWHKHGLIYRDFIHLSKEGYKLQGKLFFEALNKAITESQTHGMD